LLAMVVAWEPSRLRCEAEDRLCRQAGRRAMDVSVAMSGVHFR
jgi:hypothetical protein